MFVRRILTSGAAVLALTACFGTPIAQAADPDSQVAVTATGPVTVPSNYVYNPSLGSLHDYCTWSPDAWGKADFRGPCARHDLCYEANRSVASRDANCQTPFLNNLRNNCDWYYRAWYDAPGRTACRGVAVVYYNAVKAANR